MGSEALHRMGVKTSRILSLVETGVEVGPAIYLARVFDTDVDSVVKFFIFILIFVFDPMAVMFVISYNVTLLDREKNNDASSDSNITIRSDSHIFSISSI